ncbi:MAG: ParB N-terminal domain-containing protein [Bosea sp.]|nr:ParB N-terminal domain-containing protein [Bosea sp. (in: a-proteobacteria)]
MQVIDLPAALIYPPNEGRAIDRAVVARIAESVRERGLINPIVVKKAMKIRHGAKAEAWEIIAGNHRYEACAVTLKMETIPCIVSEADDMINELIMIDENLCRAELSPSDRAKFTARRKEIYEAAHEETKHGGDRRSFKSQTLRLENELESFTENTAKAIGKSERVVQLDAERGEKVTEEALNLIRGTHLDTGTYLDKLKRMTPNDQIAAIERDLLVERRRIREAKSDTKLADEPLNDFEAKEKQVARLMSAWNAASPEARQDFLERIDAPVFDRGGA